MVGSASGPNGELTAETSTHDAQDLVFSFALETWADTRRRGTFSPDVLVDYLLASPRVGRLVVANPWRSYLGLLRGLLRRRPQDVSPFPAAAGRALVRPRRVRRSDPVDIAGLWRWADRYVDRLLRAARSNGLQRPVLLATHPIIAAAANPDDWAHVVYYGWDDWAAHPAYRAWWPAFEHAYDEIRRHRHRVVGVSARIVERIGSAAPSAVVPNGLRPEEWESAPAVPGWFARLPAPRMLYAGTLDNRIDLQIVRAVAQLYPQGSLTFVGTPADSEVVESLRTISNVHVVGWQDRLAIRGLAFHCDVALLPHVASELTIAMSPLKVYEYLAAGRPVVAVDLEPVRGLPTVLRSTTVDQFVANVGIALATGPMSEDARRAFVATNSWHGRFERLMDVVSAAC